VYVQLINCSQQSQINCCKTGAFNDCFCFFYSTCILCRCVINRKLRQSSQRINQKYLLYLMEKAEYHSCLAIVVLSHFHQIRVLTQYVSFIALLHDDVTIKTFIEILLFNARDHGCLVGTKQWKFTENRCKTSINSRREVE